MAAFSQATNRVPQQLNLAAGVSTFRTIEKEKNMSRGSRISSLLLATALLGASMGAIGCEHHYYRVYDPYYSDYHVWNNDEVVYYNQWATETHRDPHRDFRHLSKDEQKEYWTWRHNHEHH
jgi:hypothetical protein